MGSWFSLSTILTLMTAYYIGHMINTFYKIYSVPSCKEGLACGKPLLPLQKDGKFPLVQFRVYASDKSFSIGKLEKMINNFQLADPQDIEMKVSLPLATRQNGSMFLFFVLVPNETPENVNHMAARWYTLQGIQASAYREPERTFNLINGELKEKLPPITHIRSVVNVMSLEDSPDLSLPELPEISLNGNDEGYYPLLYVADLMSREKDLVEMKKGDTHMNITVKYLPVPLGKIRFHTMISSSLKQLLQLGFTQKDLEDVKAIFGDTSLYLLGITVFVSSIHLLFDVLSFKNDISFWRERESMVGLSSKALLWRCFSYTVIFFYLQDQETSLLVIVPAGISVLIEFWKLKKAFKVSFSWQGLKFGKHSAEEEETEAFDSEAMKYLAYLMTPLCIGGAIYSLMYVPHKSWYSWVLESMANGVYAFGFLFMLPQLFVNYKLKSVAHLPWRAFTYKAFNTFIDDLFAFIIVMPTAHRVACFRDDIVFIIYLYQRYLYPVDHSRVNEFGQKGEDVVSEQKKAEIKSTEEVVDGKPAKAVPSGSPSEKTRARKRASKKID